MSLNEDATVIQQKLHVQFAKKNFGLLEKPNIPLSIPQVSFKVLVYGPTFSGKTFFIRKLCHFTKPEQSIETTGIEISLIYWPMKIGNKLLLFRLEFWDTGENSARKYDHIRSSVCEGGIDGVLICFSVNKQDSLSKFKHSVQKWCENEQKPLILGVATKLDKVSEIQISESELRNFEASNPNISIIRSPFSQTQNSDQPSSSADDATLKENETNVSLVLNDICEQLWQRDQKLIGVKREKGK